MDEARFGMGLAGTLGAVAATLGLVTACGSGFTAEDCKALHTCAADAGEANGGAADGGGSELGGAPAGDAGGSDAGRGDAGGSDGEPGGAGGSGDAGSTGDAGGTGGADDNGCESDDDCNNGDPTDGVESCGADGECRSGNPPPAVSSVEPLADAAQVEPDAPIELTFSEPLDPDTVSAETIRVSAGDEAVPGELTYQDGKVTFVPSAELGLLTEYTISVSSLVTDAEGAPLLEPFTSTFAVRDGAWHVVDAAAEEPYQISDSVPVSANGALLASWIDSVGNMPSARWFQHGASSNVQRFSSGSGFSASIAAGSNQDGVAVVVWTNADEQYARQYRAGDWSTKTDKVSSGTHSITAVAVAPEGEASFFQAWSGVRVYRSNASGAWAATPDNLSFEHPLSRFSIAFDTQGNGFAVSRVENASSLQSILASRYTTSGKKWSSAAKLPGSLAAAPADERGAPALALDDDGNAMVLWVRRTGGVSTLVASRYGAASGWSDPEPIGPSGAMPLTDPPGLVFDGKTFIAAWTAEEGDRDKTFVARYDMERGAFDEPASHVDTSPHLERMPHLVSDRHGNLLLIWGLVEAGGAALVFQRYSGLTGKWGAITPLPGGTFEDANIATRERWLATGGNARGDAAAMWADFGDPSAVRLASFY